MPYYQSMKLTCKNVIKKSKSDFTTEVRNQKLDSLGEFIYEDDYDPNKHRAIVENQSSFLIQKVRWVFCRNNEMML